MMRPLKFLTLALCFFSTPVLAENADPSAQRNAVKKMEQETLEKLYAEKPETRKEIQDSVGYAVFSSGELAVFWISAGYGHGVAHNNTDGNEVYMQMAKAGVGIGLGAKDFNIVFVFNDKDSYQKFITEGMDLTGTADVAAQTGEKGDSVSGAADVLPGVRIYQFTDTGLMAQAMVQGTKYWRDSDLNMYNSNQKRVQGKVL